MYKIDINNDDYPKILKKINNYPNSLYIEGNIEILNKDFIAVVGSRNCTEYGIEMTKKIVKELVKNNIGIISGMAVGIDRVAHETCIQNGGKTIAILGSGLNNIYPKENKKLYNLILDSGGAVITEYKPDMLPIKANFPKRNRIISGLALGTIVIEATYRSGTSITAKYALKQERKLFCIPNCVGNKNSRGTIELLKSGAKIITKGEEIIKELGIISNPIPMVHDKYLKNIWKNYKCDFKIEKNITKINKTSQILEKLDDNSQKIVKEIIIKPKSVDEISRITGLNISIINSIITVLEMEDIIKNVEGNQYILRG